jgi:hypothetical protein
VLLLNGTFVKLVALAGMSLSETPDMLYYNIMSCTSRHIQLLSTPNHVPGISACGTCKSGAFFITRDGWYSESGLSARQSVGVVPDERHELCEWLNNAGTRYPEPVADSWHQFYELPRKSAVFAIKSVVTISAALQFSATNLHASPHS